MLHLLHMGSFKCSPLFFFRFKILGSSHSWSCPPCGFLACSGGPTPTNIAPFFFDSSSLYTCTVQPGPFGFLCIPATPSPSNFLHFSIHSVFSLSVPPPVHYAPSCFSVLPAFSSRHVSLRVLQWNVEGLRPRSTELLHFILSYPVDLIRIHESNLNSSSSFRIPGFAAQLYVCTLSRSCILYPDDPHASGGVITFVR